MGLLRKNINRSNFVWTTVVSFHDEYFDPFSTINCRECNIRASLLQSPIPLSGFNYQPVFLEPEDAKCLHNPLISKSGGAKPSLTSKTSLSLKKNKTFKSDAFDTNCLKKAALFHATSNKTKNDTEAHTKCAGNTEYKVHILLFIDLVIVTKLPANLSKSTSEKHTCSICGRGYSFRSGLSKHMRSAQNDVESGLVTCTLCNRFVITCVYYLF